MKPLMLVNHWVVIKRFEGEKPSGICSVRDHSICKKKCFHEATYEGSLLDAEHVERDGIQIKFNVAMKFDLSGWP